MSIRPDVRSYTKYDVSINPIYEVGKNEPICINVRIYKIISERCQECKGTKETKTFEKEHTYYKGEEK